MFHISVHDFITKFIDTLVPLYCGGFTEEPVRIIVPLEEQNITEGQPVMLECQLSKPDRTATWLKDGEEITSDKHVELSVDGVFQRLVIHNSVLDDEAEYTVRIGDESSSAPLWVEGVLCICISSA